MQFLHDGRPTVVREAAWSPPRNARSRRPTVAISPGTSSTSCNTGTSVARNGSSDSTTTRSRRGPWSSRSWASPTTGPATRPSYSPSAGSTRGLAVGCGINPRYGRIDPYAMAGCVIDEAVRNCTAVGADPSRIAILDNFCWGSTERPETLGSLVRAAQACHDVSLAYGTPFISGKDSLNNEYTHEGRSLAIPAHAPDQRDRDRPRYPVVRDDGSQGRRELAVRPGNDAARAGGFALVGGQPAARRARAPGRSVGRRACSVPSIRRSRRGSSGVATTSARVGWRWPWRRWPWRAASAPTCRSRSVPHEADAADDFVLLFSESPTRFVLEVPPSTPARSRIGSPDCRSAVSEGSRPIPTVASRRPSADRPGARRFGRRRRLGGGDESRLATAVELAVTGHRRGMDRIGCGEMVSV